MATWVNKALSGGGPAQKQIPNDDYGQLLVRIVNKTEAQELNQSYRNKNQPTNVLSFPSDHPDFIKPKQLGDIVICAAIVQEEAQAQDKTLEAHWAHMVIHGVLHLLGHDHITENQATAMESKENNLLAELGFASPYEK